MSWNPADHIVLLVGLATMFFGFGAGALINWYLRLVKSPLVAELRGSLDYKSSIIGDGFVLPVVNMLVASFLLNERSMIGTRELWFAGICGVVITAYFHITQARRGLVNWCMPEPWHWNLLGAFHAVYMYTVSSLLGLFYALTAEYWWVHGGPPREAVLATVGILGFLWLLRIDYQTVSLRSLLPRFLRGGA